MLSKAQDDKNIENDNSAVKMNDLIATVTQQLQSMFSGMQQTHQGLLSAMSQLVADTMNRPRTVVRDGKDNIIGIQ